VNDESTSPTEQIDFLELLEQKRLTLRQKLSAHGAKDAITGEQIFPDANQAASWRNEANSEPDKDRVALAEVESAIHRLEDGSYGKCESCGEPIAPARLEALPASRLCVTCAGK
jgi:DnaK suppressor protein